MPPLGSSEVGSGGAVEVVWGVVVVIVGGEVVVEGVVSVVVAVDSAPSSDEQPAIEQTVTRAVARARRRIAPVWRCPSEHPAPDSRVFRIGSAALISITDGSGACIAENHQKPLA